MVYVYVIRSLKNECLYVGMAEDAVKRLAEHNRGKSKYTSGFMPWKLIYQEEFQDWKTGRVREKYLKSTSGKNWLRKNGKI